MKERRPEGDHPVDGRPAGPRGELRPAVVQAPDGRVLMLGYMDEEALRRTLEGGRVTFWSRSRRRLWTKGETSGHWLRAIEVRSDCDGDALLVVARPHGPTCHTGEASCFDAGRTVLAAGDVGPGDERGPHGQPAEAESGRADGARGLGRAMEDVWDVVARRDRERPEGSYTARLLEAGLPRAARKVGEEAVETAVAAVARPERVAAESADLLYHLLVLWRAAGIDPDAVAEELAARRVRRGREDAEPADPETG